MGFSSVYKALVDVFPQIDSRILRAVAIEHSKDADVAVEVVLVEIIPHLSKQSLGSSFNKAESSIGLSEDRGKTVQHKATMNSLDVISSFSRLLTEPTQSVTHERQPGATEVLDAGSSGQIIHSTVADPIASGSLGICSYHDAIGETDIVSDGLLTPLEKCNDNSNVNPDTTLPCERVSYDNNDQRCVEIVGDKAASPAESVVTDAGLSEEEVAFQLDGTTPAPASSQLLDICEKHLPVTESDLNSSLKTTSEKDAPVVELVNSEDESMMTSTLTRSSCSTELLDDIIEDARNSKKTLVSTMESVVDLMKEVEFKEKDAEHAKLEAARGCSDILAKVDELKMALRRAKEANDMHAGEVYAEKAILATELKELQLRLLTLSNERDQSLGILEEMRIALEIRLATALEEIKAAEAEKTKKLESAREALAYQESQMEKVVEESKKLKLISEENSKLQEFLMDRGRAIDMLQGEISVKCQDVRLLNEKFDKRIPLSRSLSSSLTSSFRSTATPSEPEPEPEPETYGSPKASAEAVEEKRDDDEWVKSIAKSSYCSTKRLFWKHLDEDDWELFDEDGLHLDAGC